MTKQNKFTRVILIVLLFLLSLFVLLPLLSMIKNSFMSTREIIHDMENYPALKLLPERPNLEQYSAALVDTPEFYRYSWNTMALVVPILIGTLAVSTIGAYGFAKFRFRGRKVLYFLCVFLVMLPYQIMLSPQYIVLREAGLVGTRAGVVLSSMFMPAGLFMMTCFMRAVPDETLESARMDGANEVQVFRYVALPQSAPGVALLALFTLVENWNLVEQPLVLLGNVALYPLSVALSYIGNDRPEVIYACAVVFLIPVMIGFALGVRGLVENLSRIME